MTNTEDSALAASRQIAANIERLPAYLGYGMQFACLILDWRPFGHIGMSNGSDAASEAGSTR